jgi:hypothetical protein
VSARRAVARAALVDAGPVRAHVAQLVALGLGLRQIAQLADTGTQVIQRILAGQRRIAPRTAARLLPVRACLAHGATVAGTKTWRFVDSLEREGYTRREIAWHLGAHSQQLQLHRRVRVSTALRVAQLHARLAAT